MNIDKSTPVLVTGGNGYIASWLTKYLLEQGINVRATVRDPSNEKKVGHLKKIAENTRGRLTLFQADLLKEGSFNDAMRGCELVFHTASPFVIRGIKDPQKELVDPAVKGTRNVLEAANRIESVKRVVLTSSVVAIYGDAVDMQQTKNGIFTEEHWNTTSSAAAAKGVHRRRRDAEALSDVANRELGASRLRFECLLDGGSKGGTKLRAS